jgi:hypothetical protein
MTASNLLTAFLAGVAIGWLWELHKRRRRDRPWEWHER